MSVYMQKKISRTSLKPWIASTINFFYEFMTTAQLCYLVKRFVYMPVYIINGSQYYYQQKF